MNHQRKAVTETINLYESTGWKRFFSRLRFWYAPFEQIERLLPNTGTITDLGCGEGVLTNYIGLAGSKRKVIGIELDSVRVEQANHGVANVSFQHGDITKTTIPSSDAIIIFHVLHHLPTFAAQEAVLQACYRKLKPGGKLIIVEILIRPSLRYWAAWFTDHFLVAWIFEKRFYSPILFRPLPKWQHLLKNIGFHVQVIPLQRQSIFSNVVISCEKK